MLRLSCRKCLCVALFLISFIIISPSVFADGNAVTSEVNVNVEVSCSISGSGVNSHYSTISNGTYASDIGTTTFDVFCNDYDGFAIYAIGYTDGIDGKNVLTNSTLGSGSDINTGTLTSGNTSQWAMKLSTDSGTPFTIQNSYDVYHTVPDDYELVAKRPASTSLEPFSVESSFTSTYQVYASGSQPAGTYLGRVKYVMVHPNNAPKPVGENQVGVIYSGNGLFFDQAGTESSNTVVYEKQCEDEYGYIGDTPAIIKTRNLDNDGNQNGPYSEGGGVWYEGDGLDPSSVSFEGASSIIAVVTYGLGEYSTTTPDFYTDFDNIEHICGDLCDTEINRSGTETFVLQGSYFGTYIELGSMDVDPDYDYGIYIQVYPVYDEPTEGATYGLVQNVCSYYPVKGTYAETIPFKDYWYTYDEWGRLSFYDENVVMDYLKYNQNDLNGTTITLLANNPYRVFYNGNGATAGTMSDFYKVLETEPSENTFNLLAPNFKKTGYGFAGWSENPNATVNGDDVIYGPNEEITGDELTFDRNKDTTLYAVWVAPENGITMQTFDSTAEPYASYDVGTVIALRDIRDDDVYAISKFADGNWWMMENLRLNPATAVDGNGNTTINSLTTNSPTSYFVDTNIAAILNGTDTTHWKTCQSDNATCDNQISFGAGNTNLNYAASPSASSQYNSWYSYGVFYNYYTATAGNGTYGAAANDKGDICPIHWRIPRSWGNLLYNSLGLTDNTFEAGRRIREYPYNFIHAGRYYGSNAAGRNTFTAHMTTSNGIYSRNAAILSLHQANGARWGNIETAKWNGYPVRCYAVTSD